MATGIVSNLANHLMDPNLSMNGLSVRCSSFIPLRILSQLLPLPLMDTWFFQYSPLHKYNPIDITFTPWMLVPYRWSIPLHALLMGGGGTHTLTCFTSRRGVVIVIKDSGKFMKIINNQDWHYWRHPKTQKISGKERRKLSREFIECLDNNCIYHWISTIVPLNLDISRTLGLPSWKSLMMMEVLQRPGLVTHGDVLVMLVMRGRRKNGQDTLSFKYHLGTSRTTIEMKINHPLRSHLPSFGNLWRPVKKRSTSSTTSWLETNVAKQTNGCAWGWLVGGTGWQMGSWTWCYVKKIKRMIW